MKKVLLAAAFIAVSNIYAQEITLDKIYSGYYRGKGIAGISSLKSGESYAVLEPAGIVKYSYKNTGKEGTLVEGKFQGYEFSGDESKVMLTKESQPVYRHSYLGKFEIRDLNSGKTLMLHDGEFVQEPRFSPDGTKVAYVAENNLFYQDLSSGKITQITTDGKKNEILNGLADWVYEEEFAHARLFEWTKNSNAIVFVRSDESAVREVNLPIYDKQLYPSEMKFKYPKAGETNSTVSAHLYRLATGGTSRLDLSGFKQYYIPNVIRTEANDEMILLTSERTQNATDV